MTEHVYFSSAVGYLSGRKRAFIAGYFEFDGAKVEISPIIIGEFISEFCEPPFQWRWPQHSRIYPWEIDSFAKAEKVRSPTPKPFEILRDIPEADLKAAFAAIIGETFIPKDWGGERSDLYTGRLAIDKKNLSAAFLLKGPSIFRPMHPADLGKRGDQLIRLFDEPSDLMILQHCHKIETTVIKQLEALAVHPSRPRMYCVIDGADTYRILKAYNQLPR